MKLSEATILLVDDEPLLLEIHGLWLKLAGCGRVLTAADGESALKMLEAHRVDLIISDIRMPSMDGLTLVNRMAEREICCVPTILVSGCSDVDHREMYALGVSAILMKPTSRAEMTEVAERSLRDATQLWEQPMPVTPRQCIEIELAASEDADSFQFGRRGFSAFYPGPIVLGKVAFRCQFSAHPWVLAGEGHVLWYSRIDQAIGVEFSYLELACRPWVLQQIHRLNTRSFIPDLRPASKELVCDRQLLG